MTATTWDLHRDTRERWDDAQLVMGLAKEYGGPVLDLGCGTGRIVLDFLKAGLDTEGVDNSPEMLEICRVKGKALGLSPVLHRQSITNLSLPKTYGVIFGSSSILQLITDPVEAQAAVRRIRDFVKPGGIFLTPFAFAWVEGTPLDSGWQPHFERVRPEDGALIRATIREWQEPENQLWHTEERFEILRDGKPVKEEVHKRSPEGRWYTREQAESLFLKAGFT